MINIIKNSKNSKNNNKYIILCKISNIAYYIYYSST